MTADGSRDWLVAMAGTKPRTQVALLRGINVGGKNKLTMADLRTTFEQAGAASVETYIQSGNVLFEAPPRAAPKIARTVSRAIAEQWGYTVPVVVRSASDLADVIDRNPFVDVDPSSLHAAFLADSPGPEAIAELDPQRSPGDAFEVRGATIYLHLPGGVARTKLTNAYFDRVLGTFATVRNWRTVLELHRRAGTRG